MSEERDRQIFQKWGNTPIYLLSLIVGIGSMVVNVLYTFTIPGIDLFVTWIYVILNICLVATSLTFAYLNENFLRIVLKTISVILALVGWCLSLPSMGLFGLVVFSWFGVSLFLIFSTFKWLKETDEGGEVAYIMRKNFSYYTCLVLGLILIGLFALAVWLSEPDTFSKLMLLGVSGLLLLVSLAFSKADTRKNRVLLTCISGSLTGIHGYLSVALYPEIAVYVFGWFGFALLLVFASYNWLKELD